MLPEEENPPLWNIKNKEGNTILHELACSDSMKNLAGKVLGRYEPYEDKHTELEMLLTARNEFGETPIFCAARHGQTEMFEFLAEKMNLNNRSEEVKHHLQRDDKTTVLHISITTECFDWSVKEAMRKSEERKHCEKLAQILVEEDTSWNADQNPVEKASESSQKQDGKISHGSTSTSEYNKSIEHTNKKSEDNPLFLATISNNSEIVRKILISHPQAIEDTKEGMNILHVAILYRHIQIFDMVVEEFEVFSRRLLSATDGKGNSLLHIVGQKKKSQVNETMQNPALQLQTELLLFEKVKKACQVHVTKPLNEKNKTAEELFATSNEKLRQKAEEWLMRSTENCTLLSVFIATVAFAAAYTVPGGPDQNTGIPILNCKPFFVVFIIADVISLTLALTSVGIFLSILQSSFPLEEFKKNPYEKLKHGIICLMLSVLMMAVAFGATIILIMKHNRKNAVWYVVAFLPVPIFPLSYSPLRSAVLRTHDTKALLKHVNKPIKVVTKSIKVVALAALIILLGLIISLCRLCMELFNTVAKAREYKSHQQTPGAEV